MITWAGSESRTPAEEHVEEVFWTQLPFKRVAAKCTGRESR
jgi:hypothetical protein